MDIGWKLYVNPNTIDEDWVPQYAILAYGNRIIIIFRFIAHPFLEVQGRVQQIKDRVKTVLATEYIKTTSLE